MPATGHFASSSLNIQQAMGVTHSSVELRSQIIAPYELLRQVATRIGEVQHPASVAAHVEGSAVPGVRGPSTLPT